MLIRWKIIPLKVEYLLVFGENKMRVTNSEMWTVTKNDADQTQYEAKLNGLELSIVLKEDDLAHWAIEGLSYPVNGISTNVFTAQIIIEMYATNAVVRNN